MFDATRKYYDMHWQSGELFDDFLVRLWKEATRADHTILQACTSAVPQLPKTVQQQAKVWINGKEHFRDKEGREFMVEMRKNLMEKGIAADLGWRQKETVSISLVEGSMVNQLDSKESPFVQGVNQEIPSEENVQPVFTPRRFGKESNRPPLEAEGEILSVISAKNGGMDTDNSQNEHVLRAEEKDMTQIYIHKGRIYWRQSPISGPDSSKRGRSIGSNAGPTPL